MTSAYEYLEARFGPSIRVIGSLLFVLFHIGRVAIVIYLPTLAITSVSDMNPYVVASLVGILCILYTFLGGFEGVVWSDFIQGVILLGGAAAIIILGVVHIQGEWAPLSVMHWNIIKSLVLITGNLILPRQQFLSSFRKHF